MDLRQQEVNKDRIVFFSDAVFAIAMTLLALELIPKNVHPGEPLWPVLLHSQGKILSFVIGFAVIGLFWMAHVRNFRWIERADGVLIWLNLAIMLLVCFMPLPTALLGEFGSDQVAVIFYAGTVLVLGALQTAMWAYASHNYRLIAKDTPLHVIRATLMRSIIPPLVFGISILIALRHPQAAMWSWIAIEPLSIMTRLIARPGAVVKDAP